MASNAHSAMSAHHLMCRVLVCSVCPLLLLGEAVAKRRRMPSSKGFDFFVESSFAEIYNEQCHDLYSKGAAVASNLPVRAIGCALLLNAMWQQCPMISVLVKGRSSHQSHRAASSSTTTTGTSVIMHAALLSFTWKITASHHGAVSHPFTVH
jgi:hypothetical protein